MPSGGDHVSLDIQHPCNGLIRRSIELRALYCHAATRVNEPGLRTVLEEEAQSLSEIIGELQAHLRSRDGTPATRCGVIGTARQQWDNLLPRNDDAWIRVLAQQEQKLLHAFERVLTKVTSSETAAALHRQLLQLRSIDLDMHSLAQAIGVVR